MGMFTQSTAMALKKLTIVLVLLFCRFTLFSFIAVLFWILQGMPNLNSCLLMVSITNNDQIVVDSKIDEGKLMCRHAYVSFARVKEKQGLIDYGKLHLLLTH